MVAPQQCRGGIAVLWQLAIVAIVDMERRLDLDGDIEVNDDRQYQEDNAAHSDLAHGIED